MIPPGATILPLESGGSPSPLPPSGRGSETSPIGTCILFRMGRATIPFSQALHREGIQAVEVQDLARAGEVLQELRPQVILVGPEAGSPPLVDVVAELRKWARDADILLLLDAVDRSKALRALAAGADDIVTPPHSASRVLLRAYVVRERAAVKGDRDLGGGRPSPSPHRVSLKVEESERALVVAGTRVQLAPRELELLQRLDRARGTVVSRESLLEEIWGKDGDDDAVLDATVHRLRKKIEPVVPADEILVTVRGVGYRLESGPGTGRPSQDAETRDAIRLSG